MTTTEDPLDAFGLEKGQTIRYQANPNARYIEGSVMGVGRDGSLTVYAKGKTRSFAAEKCERKTRGPRGGAKWEPVSG